ncbi:choice-of-anchor D domain-containing protein [Marivirga sp. S37H4]|uniref:Choice-of-anchor D domain-containing protein n=1 Tax=Marivirga aurantiaca TaxID=2802615 RepID=A0A934WYC6_9BACT|nr:choice-of-anchor D domain-containing protein [Marivirga aurantiaca]MBK6265264.1 choice-of-anchor D domain-containing protein [Marivirga aurantiaca]
MIIKQHLHKTRNMRIKIGIGTLLLLFILLSIVSCKEESEEPVAEFSISSEEVNFGEIEISKQLELNLSVTNTGGADLILESFNISGANANQFDLEVEDIEESVKANTTYEFSIIFRPDQEGQKAALLTIFTNIGDYEVELKGVALPEPVGILVIDPEVKDFGEVEINSTSTAVFTLTNTGNAQITVAEIVLQGNDMDSYQINPDVQSLAPEESYNVEVTFAPEIVGSKNASVMIKTNIGDYEMELTGIAIPEPVGILVIDSEMKDFGEVEINSTSTAVFNLSNVGNANLSISEIVLNEGDISDFQMNPDIQSLAPEESYDFEVTFAPETSGDKSAKISIVTNIGSYNIDLQGNAVFPEPVVNFSDAAFKASLLEHGLSISGEGISKIDTNNDGEIQLSEAESYNGTIKCHDAGISSLSGIEAFKNITRLSVLGNNLTSFDISHNTALVFLNCSANQLTSLDVSNNTALETIYCSNNELISLDLTQNVSLKGLYCNNNKLTHLNIQQNVGLEHLYCQANQLTLLEVYQNINLINLRCQLNQLNSLDISENVNLDFVDCSSNQLSVLNITQNTKLKTLVCSFNKLKKIDLLQNKELEYLYCDNNQLTNLYAIENSNLKTLWCHSNQLNYLTLSNGNNSILTQMKAHYNDNLYCIQIDPDFNPPSTWSKPAAASYSTGCP